MKTHGFKTLLTSIVMMLCCMSATAAGYKVEIVRGNVLLQRGNSWVKVTKSTVLSDNDRVKLADGATLTLEDGVRKVRSWSKPGPATVKALIQELDDKDGATLSFMIGALKGRLVASGSGQNGSGVRGTGFSPDATEAVYTALHDLLASARNTTDTTLMSLDKIPTDDGFRFAVANNSDKTMYYNVAHVDSAGHVTMVYPVTGEAAAFAIPAKEEVDIRGITFTKSLDRYILIGCETEFSSDDIVRLFTDNEKPLDPDSLWPRVTLIAR